MEPLQVIEQLVKLVERILTLVKLVSAIWKKTKPPTSHK